MSTSSVFPPDIVYHNEKVHLFDKINGQEPPLLASTKTMKAIVHGLYPNIDVTSWESDDQLEKVIEDKIKQSKGETGLEEIFHLIEIWGGSAGRMLYINKKHPFVWKDFEPKYRHLAETCFNASAGNDLIDKIYNVVNDCRVPYFGVAFITKHTRFWLEAAEGVGNNALPIYDSVMAKNAMGQKGGATISKLKEYWQKMENESNNKGVDLVPFERDLFKYYFKP